MTKPHEPINSIPDLNTHPSDWYGLTKREYFAALAMQGFCVSVKASDDTIAMHSVTIADALIKALNETK